MARSLVVSAFVALIALAFSVPATASPTVATIYHQVQLPVRSGALITEKVTCPPGYRAVSGATDPLPADVVLLRNGSVGASQVFLLSPAGYGPTTVTLIVTCIKTKVVVLKGTAKGLATLKIKTSATKTVPAVGSTGTKVALTCPAGTAPVGTNTTYKLVSVPRAPPPQVAIEVRFIESMPVKGGWELSMFNAVPSGSGGVELSLNCLKRVARARAHGRRISQRFDVVRRLVDGQVPAGGSLPLDVGCPPGMAPLTPAFDIGNLPVAQSALRVLGTHPDMDTAGIRFLIANPSLVSGGYEAGGLCLKAKRKVIEK